MSRASTAKLRRTPRGQNQPQASIAATTAKNEFGRILEKAIRGETIVITKHNTPKAVLISVEQFRALERAPESKLNDLSEEFDALLARMQGTKARNAMQAAFSASPKQIAKAAVLAARRNA